MDTNKILELKQAGKNSLEIAKELNYDKKEVDLFLIKQISSSKLSIQDWKDIINKRHNGLPFIKIAKEYHVSDAFISKNLKKAQIKFICPTYYDYTAITSEQIEQLKKDLNNKKSLKDIKEETCLSKFQVKNICKANGIKIREDYDDTFFDIIDTEEKAYWLGFMYADGNVPIKISSCEVSLQILDVDHLIKLKSDLHAKNKISYDFKVERCRFHFGNKHLKQALINKGCIPQKSLILTFPTKEQVPETLWIPFIRGYFDGDGCFTHNFCDTKHKRVTVSCGFIGTEMFLNTVKSILSNYNINGHLYTDKKRNPIIKTLEFGKKDSVKLLNLLYTNANVYLTRKYNKYLFFKSYKNFAVNVSDYIDYNRAKSVKAKQVFNNYFKVDFDTLQANTEVIKSAKTS